jgi:phage terminase large subunit
MQQPNFPVPIPNSFRELFYPHRYKVMWGGRGAAKSWSIARALITLAHLRKLRIGCFRELQASIAESVHQLLKDQIYAMGLQDCFRITQSSIISRVTGSEFLFKGLRHNITEIKSLEGIDIAWVEEAQHVSKDSWELLIPTIRKNGSEIWVSFNPVDESDPTYVRFVASVNPDAWVLKCSWRDNPWFTDTQNKERLWLLQSDPDAYEHVYEGGFLRRNNAIIFSGKYIIDTFEAPHDVTLRFGADFGFAVDPSTLIRSYITGKAPLEELWIEHEAYGVGVELHEMSQLYDSVPGSRSWPIKADSSRPETISYMRREGFNIAGAEKWDGSVEDGIQHIKGFKVIHIHQRCKHVQQEARLYAYKVDRVTGDVLPIIIDKNNHCWDAQRYALDGFIQHRGGLGVWERL